MSKDKISDYSATANSNTDIAGINIDEGCAPSGINNAIRTLMKQIKDLYAGTSGDKWPVAAGGTGGTTASEARTNLGLVIGTDVQAYDADLAAIASSGKGDQIVSYGTYGVGFKNRIINGDMRIDQRNAGASVNLADGIYNLDRYQGSVSQSSKVTVQRSSTAPAGFINSQVLTVSSAMTFGAGDYCGNAQAIEGYNVSDLGFGTASAQSVTVSFWVRSSVTGTYSVTLHNSAFDRTNAKAYTISSANTWEQKTITFSGDTSGTWLTNNGIGIKVYFALGMGSTYGGATDGVWSSTPKLAVTGQTNWASTAGATFYITGVQLEKGSTATSFDYRPYGTELQLCQRYYWKCTASLGSSFSTSGTAGGGVRMPVTMRTTPTLEAGGTFAVSSGNAGTPAAYTSTGGGSGGDAVNVYNSANNWTTNQAVALTAGFTAEL